MNGGGGLSSGVKVLGACHFQKKIWAIIPYHYLKKGTHNSVSLTRKVQSHRIKKRIVIAKDTRFIILFQVHRCEDSKFLLVSKCIPMTSCTFPLC